MKQLAEDALMLESEEEIKLLVYNRVPAVSELSV